MLTMTRIVMDEVEFMRMYATVAKAADAIDTIADAKVVISQLLTLIGSLNDRVTELQVEDDDE